MIRLGNIKDYHCSRCKSKDFTRVKRPLLIRMLSFGADVKRYQCTKCWKIVYVVNKRSPERKLLLPAHQIEA
jgi:DNA-directed RNA polymerase subunit RPC12/RpoP